MDKNNTIHNKKRNKIRLHHEGNHTLLLCGFIAAAAIALSIIFLRPIWIAYIIMGIFLIVYGILVNFFRCPIRMFQGPTTKTVVAPADGKVVVVEEV